MKTNNLNYPLTDRLNMRIVDEMGNVMALIEDVVKPMLRPHKLGYFQFRVMEMLYHGENLRIGDLTFGTHTTGGNMTVILRKLSKAGLISRVVDPDDARAFNIILTQKGKSLFEKVYPVYLKHLEEKLSPLVRSEREELGRLLNKIMEPPVKMPTKRKPGRNRKA